MPLGQGGVSVFSFGRNPSRVRAPVHGAPATPGTRCYGWKGKGVWLPPTDGVAWLRTCRLVPPPRLCCQERLLAARKRKLDSASRCLEATSRIALRASLRLARFHARACVDDHVRKFARPSLILVSTIYCQKEKNRRNTWWVCMFVQELHQESKARKRVRAGCAA